MSTSLKSQLLKAASEDDLLAERDLDLYVLMDEVPQPFVFRPQPPSQEPNLLGEPLEGIPLDLHSQLTELASQGSIPRTTPAMRAPKSTNQKHGVSSTPLSLLEPFAMDIFSPNLPPPAGMLWRAHGGTWRLAPRGG